MNAFFPAIQSILPLFLVIFTGIGLARMKLVHQGWVEVLNKYALWIGFPALIFGALVRLDFRFSEFSSLIFANSGYLIGCILLAYPVSVLFKTSLTTRRTLFLILGFRNISYLGIPLITGALGAVALGSAILISAVYLFWMFTLAIVLIEVNGHEQVHWLVILQKLGTNPLLLAVFLGLLASWLKFPAQGDLMKTVDLFGQSVTAVVLLSLGIFLGLQQIGSRAEWIPVLGLSVLNMIILPGIFYYSTRGLGMSLVQFRASILDSALPTGLTAYAMTERYQLNVLLTGRLVILSTLLAAVIIPVWIVFTT